MEAGINGELIPIQTTQSGSHVVSARDLHSFLAVGTDFSTWCQRMFEYGFVEGFDFSPILGKSQGGRPSTDYALAMDCAKEIAMIQRTERGKQARLYFIEVEKQFVAQQQKPALFDPASVSRKELALLVLEAESRIEQLGQEVVILEKVVVSQAKKVAYVDEVLTAKNCWTTTSIAKSLDMSAIGLNQLLHQLNVQFKRDGHWVLYHQYQNKGYTQTETHPYTGTDGGTRTSLSTVWTELGRAFITKKVTDYRKKQALLATVQTQPQTNA